MATSLDRVTAPVAGFASSRWATIGVIGRSVVATTGSLPTGATSRRGQTKSSARPAGAVTASPLTSTFVTIASAASWRPSLPRSEGSTVQVAAGYLPDEYRLVGKISGPAPFSFPNGEGRDAKFSVSVTGDEKKTVAADGTVFTWRRAK